MLVASSLKLIYLRKLPPEFALNCPSTMAIKDLKLDIQIVRDDQDFMPDDYRLDYFFAIERRIQLIRFDT